MKGYAWGGSASSPLGEDALGLLAPWESVAVEAVGNVIEFWGFKRNQGRVWALLYLRDAALTATELEDQLGLSKGGVSMLVRDLERWGVVLRVRTPGSSAWHYAAETDLMRMVTRVVGEREANFIARVRADLAEARRLAGASHVSGDRLVRLDKVISLAQASERALRIFVKTAKLDVAQMLSVFRGKRSLQDLASRWV